MTNAAALSEYLFIRFSILGLSIALTACSSLLPHSTQKPQAPWGTYAEAKDLFGKIVPDQTSVAALKEMGFDPKLISNFAILNHVDLMRRLVGTNSFDVRLLETSLQSCITAQATCYAYEIEQTYTEKQRVGNFWLDFLNFKKKIDITGWQFDAIIVIHNEVVIYKLWSGKPNIHQFEEERNPLGPLQGFGPNLLLPQR
jgi:hypothetical protein